MDSESASAAQVFLQLTSPSPTAARSLSSDAVRDLASGDTSRTCRLGLAPSLSSDWSPKKLSNEEQPTRTRRKISESRGVKLPDIQIVPNVTHPVGAAREGKQNGKSGFSPPLTSSPVGFVIRPFAKRSPTGSNTNTPERTLKASVLDICIYLPDNRGIQFSVDGGRQAAVGFLEEMIWTHLGLAPELAKEAFALWMVSPLMEVQLKKHHIPFQVRRYWPELLAKFTTESSESRLSDEPILIFRRNVLLTKKREIDLCHPVEKAAEILFLDAREMFLSGKLICDLKEAMSLAAIDMALSWGPYKRVAHTPAFVRDSLDDFLPEHHVQSTRSWSLFGWSVLGCRGQEDDLLQNYRSLSGRPAPQLRLLYLQLAMRLPMYGAAFFSGQMERPPSSRRLLRQLSGDLHVLVGISMDWVSVVDPQKRTVLVSVPVEDCSWRKLVSIDLANPHCLPSFFLHFPEAACQVCSGPNRSKLIQIFSKQAVMMEALLNTVVQAEDDDEEEFPANDAIDSDSQMPDTHVLLSELPSSPVLSNKLNRVCLATFDSEGECVDAVGSLEQILR